MLHSRRTAVHRTAPRRGRVAALMLGGAVLAAPAVALAGNNPSFKATVPFSGGRTTDLHVGEPLEFSFHGETIKRVCWTPAPLERSRCGTEIAAPAKAGTQKLRVTLGNGRSYTESLTIGTRATHLPTSIDEAAATSARVVEYKATCGASGYASYSGGKFHGKREEATVKKGDLLAAYYRVGTYAIQAMPYASPVPAFYSSSCLQRVQ